MRTIVTYLILNMNTKVFCIPSLSSSLYFSYLFHLTLLISIDELHTTPFRSGIEVAGNITVKNSIQFKVSSTLTPGNPKEI